jgi:RNA polymerase sigma-70 factor (ECF subfamily)
MRSTNSGARSPRRDWSSTEDQSLLALRIDQGLSWAEIAEITSEEGQVIQTATLMKRFERLKARLADMARAQGLTS